MAIRHMPARNHHQVRLIDVWRPSHTSSHLSVVNTMTRQPIALLSWGGELYLPTVPGLQFGVVIRNNNADWRAYPTYIEGACLYDSGPSHPDDCQTSHMWELRPGESITMDAIIDPNRQVGRPLTIVDHGQGFGIGETTFKSDLDRGAIRVYERRQNRVGVRGHYSRGATAASYDPYALRGDNDYKGGATAPATFGDYGLEGLSVRGSHQVGIGAGAEEYRQHTETGVTYLKDATLLASLQIESEADLRELLDRARRPGTAPQVPIAPQQRHIPFGSNNPYAH